MTPLEARLTAMADSAFPPTPDLAATWDAKPLTVSGNATRSRRGHGALAVVAALVLGGGATVAAVELAGPEDVQVTRVETLPSIPVAPPGLGREVAGVEEASALAGFDVRTHVPPRSVHVDRDGIVTLVYDDVVITQTQGFPLEKVVGPDTDVRVLRVAGARAVFFTGGDPRIYDYAKPRLTESPTLVVQARELLIRIEGASLERARQIATDLLRFPAP